jgi:hypothetical protein
LEQPEHHAEANGLELNDPAFNQYGCLPEGIHDCTMDEAAQRFAVFQSSDRRPQLWAKFIDFVRELKSYEFIEAVLIDGSFVTDTPEPNDIDLVLVAVSSHDFSIDLPPGAYSVLAQHRVRRRFGFDIVVVENGTEDFDQAGAFFQQIKQRPGMKKGILRIKL